jgi:hypothetical protein
MNFFSTIIERKVFCDVAIGRISSGSSADYKDNDATLPMSKDDYFYVLNYYIIKMMQFTEACGNR